MSHVAFVSRGWRKVKHHAYENGAMILIPFDESRVVVLAYFLARDDMGAR